MAARGTGPYRAGEIREDAPTGAGGIVADLVKQFADPLAFYRELVQNAIDAETEEVVVTVQHSPGAPVVVSVADRGEGMTLEVLQEKLLVLFRSGKEDQDDKIGKFGVGFVSVLAVAPERVTVRTSRGDGKSHVLHLHRDHSYELFETSGGDRSGTTVALTIAVPEGEVPDFVARSQAALERWCRHARTPIAFREVSRGAVVAEARIDRPLGFDDALVQVQHREKGTRVVVALSSDGRSYAGFFNQGLLLHETLAPFGGVLDAVRFVVQDPHLEHTLSREDVRRDDAFERALRLAERVTREQLVPAAMARLAVLAESSPSDHRTLLVQIAKVAHVLPVEHRELTLRRIDPVDGRRAVRLDRGTVPVVASRSDGLTRLLAERGHAVVPATVQLPLETMGVPFEVAHRDYTRAVPAEPRPADEALLGALEVYLDHADRAPASLAFVAMLGLGESRTYVPGELDGGETLLEGELDADPFRLVARPGLLIDVGDALVRAARAMAEDDPQVAAALLGRDVLLAHGRLDDGSDEALTEAALDDVLRLSP